MWFLIIVILVFDNCHCLAWPDNLVLDVFTKLFINMKNYYVYILTSKKNWTLYIGVTNNLLKRIYEHKNKLMLWFTANYNINKLVYFEETNAIYIALQREKNLKKWNRIWKIKLIEKFNPNWDDLYTRLSGQAR